MEKTKSKNFRLINNEKIKKNVILRAKVLSLIREFFNGNSFMEVDTPLLDLYPSMEPYISSFQSSYFDGAKEHKMYLQSSPEYNMKKLLVSGYEKIYQITKSFRNNELTRIHNPEFTILEWYRTNDDYNSIMTDIEKLLPFICRGLKLDNGIKYLDKGVDFSPPYDRILVKDAFKDFSNIDLDDVTSDKYYKILHDRGARLEKGTVDFNTFFYYIFVNEIEPNLGIKKPVFLVDFPEQLGSLARRKESNPKYVERFELYIHGLELCNAFSELNDCNEQRERFLKEKKVRIDKKLTAYPVDEDFLSFLEYGMPDAAGVALGIDRLLMLFADTNNINDVILFPFSMMTDFKESV